MSNLDKDSKDVLVVALIGGILGICAASIYFSSKEEEESESKENRSSLSSIGRLMVPKPVMHQLVMPLALPGLQIDGHNALPE